MPETIGFLVLNLIGVTTIGGFAVTAATATIIGDVVLATAAIGLNYALNKPDGPKPQDGQVTTRQALPARRRNYGTVKIGPALMFSEVSNGRLYQVGSLNQGEIDSFVSHYFDDVRGTLNDQGYVTDIYFKGTTFYVNVQPRAGSDHEVAYSDLLITFPELWTSQHVGNGLAKVLVISTQPKAEDFTSVYQGGQPPAYRTVANTAKVWDPRDSNQDRNNKDTWRFSRNSVLLALDFHRHPDGMGMAALDDVLFNAAAIAEDWIPAANVCEQSVDTAPTGGGHTIYRYEASGGYELPLTTPKAVLKSLLNTCDGWTYQRSDGAIGIRVATPVIRADVALADEMILSYAGMRRGPKDSLIPVNQVTAKYTEPALDYQEQDAAPWRDEVAISAAGRVETRDIDLTWVSSHPQARRLMKLAFYRFNPKWSGQIVTNFAGLAAYTERYIRLSITELEIEDETFEIVAAPIIDLGSASVTYVVSSMPQAAFDWDPDTEDGSPPGTPDQSSHTEVIGPPEDLATSGSAAAVTITWSAPARVDLVAEAQYSVHAAETWLGTTLAADGQSAVTPSIAAGHYDFRVRFRTGTLVSDWSEIFNIGIS